jgi:hypothetical protein
MVKMVKVKALIILALILHPIVCYNTIPVYATSTPTLNVTGISDRWVNLSVRINVFDIARINIRVYESFSAPYSIIAYYELYTPAIEGLLGLKPLNARIAVTVTAVWGVWAYSEYTVEGVGFRGALTLSEIPGRTLNPRLKYHLYVDKLTLSLSDGFRILGYEFNLGALLGAHGIHGFWFIPGIRYAMVELEPVLISETAAIYRMLRGGVSMASVYVMAYPTFRNASTLIIDYRVAGVRVADLPNLTVNLRISANNIELPVSRELGPGDSMHIPAHIPVVGPVATLKEVTLASTFLGFTPVTYNISRDTGLITIRVVELSPIRYPLKVIKVESLGEGWVAVYIGTNTTASYRASSISYTPHMGFQEPLAIKVAELRNILNHTLVYKVLMAFPQEGTSKGLITIRREDPGRPIVLLEAEVEFEVRGSSSLEIRRFNVTPTVLDKRSFISLEIFNLKRRLALGYYRGWEKNIIEERIVRLERELEITPADSKVILVELAEPLPIKISENLVLEFTLTLKASDQSKPIEIQVIPEFAMRGLRPHGERYSWWLNTTTTGYKVLKTGNLQEYNLTIILSHAIEELLEHGVPLDNILRRIIVEVDNVEDITITRVYGYILELNTPQKDPRIVTTDLALEVPAIPIPVIPSPVLIIVALIAFLALLILLTRIAIARLESYL